MEEGAFNQGIWTGGEELEDGGWRDLLGGGNSKSKGRWVWGRASGLQGLSGVSQAWTGVRPRRGLYWTVRGSEIRALALYHCSGSLAKAVQRFGPDWGRGLLCTWLVQD